MGWLPFIGPCDQSEPLGLRAIIKSLSKIPLSLEPEGSSLVNDDVQLEKALF